jgi:hypothetical protein
MTKKLQKIALGIVIKKDKVGGKNRQGDSF